MTLLQIRTGRTQEYPDLPRPWTSAIRKTPVVGSVTVTSLGMHLLKRPYPEWTVARATRVMHFQKDPALRAELDQVGCALRGMEDRVDREVISIIALRGWSLFPL